MNPFYNSNQETIVTQGNLPHWTQQGKLHFVTFRLADSLPQERLRHIQKDRCEWTARHQQPYANQDWQEYYSLFSERVENWLDAGHGECLFSNPQYAKIVADALLYFENNRYLLDHWVIMPNHVHVVLMPLHSHTLESILHSWKSFTSNIINSLRHLHGQLWQHESFDHVVRSTRQLEHFRQYILDNWKQTKCTTMMSVKSFDPKQDASATLK
jgi:REP element-mobilizing transposase RayT